VPRLALAPSSNIASAEYDPERKVLTVNFHHGGSYSYAGVEQATVSGFEMAPSPGGYFARAIKDRFPVSGG
jgi:hypothetical protein